MMTKILFVCAQNKLRSPNAETVFSEYQNIKCTSTGIHESANTPIDAETIQWADIIFTMEKKHKVKIQQKFRHVINGKKIISTDPRIKDIDLLFKEHCSNLFGI